MKKILTNINKPLFILTIIFTCFGLIMIQSASSMESYMRYGASPYNYFFKQLIFVIIGLIGYLIIIFLPTEIYNKISKSLMYISLLVLASLFIWGTPVHNAKSWFDLKFFKFQPAEVYKIVIIIYMAVYYSQNINKLEEKSILLKPLLFIAIGFLLIASQPDLGTASITMLLALLIFYSVPMPKRYKSLINKLLVCSTLLFALIFIAFGKDILHSYQMSRLNFLDPCLRYQEQTGYQLCNGFIAFNNGGLKGQGIGESTQKYLYLPESYTDFIFPIIVEEWGLIVGIVIIILYFIMLYLTFRIAKNANNLKNSLITYGVCMYLLLHIIINLGGVLGLIPLTGVPLPFLSYGGSYTLSLLCACGLVQRVNIESKIALKRKKTV